MHCQHCKNDLKGSKSSFINLSIEEQLIKIISENFDAIMDYKTKRKQQENTTISDVHDGKIWKDLIEVHNFYSMTMNTDGVLIHQSSQSTLWPVFFVCNFLPPQLRFKEKHMITAGLFYDVNKPEFHKYLEPIVREFEKLTIDGVVINSENFRFIVTHSAVDLPCESALQCIVQYNGYRACSYCEHPGEKLEFK